MIDKAVNDKLQTVQREFENREEEYKKTISQKEELIKIKEDQNQKYALLKQEEKKEKEEWIKRHDEVKKTLTDKNEILQKEKVEIMSKFYNVKMYMIIF